MASQSLPETYKVLMAQPNGADPKLEEVKLEKPGANKILIKIDFAPINPSDVMTIQGVYPVPAKKPHPLGFEGSGTVVALGEGLKVPHQVGDKVHVSGLGTWGQYILADSEVCGKVQGDISQEQAACHVVNPGTTVHFADIVEQKNPKKAAIHTAGASALGRMMIRYFKKRGLKLINIVRRDEYIEELKKEGADYVLNCKADNFESQLKEIAEKEGATICFESICGELTGKVLKNMPESSTMYVYGALAGGKLGELGADNFIFEDKTVTGLWFSRFMKTASLEEKMKVLKEAHSLLTQELRSDIQRTYKLEEVKEALEQNAKSSSKGKVLFKPN